MSDSNALKQEVVGTSDSEGQVVVPLLSEQFAVTKEKRNTGRVRVTTITREREELVDELLAREQVEVERTAIGKLVDAVPPVREEGDVIVIPVVEEFLVINRRLVLKEEVRIRRTRSTERHQERITLRKQEAVIARLPAEPPTGEANLTSTDRSADFNQEKK